MQRTLVSRTALAVLAVWAVGCSGDDITRTETPEAAQPAPPIQLAPGIIATEGYDLTSLAASANLNAGVVAQQSNFDGSTGTGVFQSFVRLQQSGSEAGHNTSGRPLQYNENSSPQFTIDLPLSAIPLKGLDPADETGPYREVRADINQVAGDPNGYLSLDVIRVCVSQTAGLVPAAKVGGPLCSDFTGGQTVWEFQGQDGKTFIALNYNLAPGSGNGDMRLLIPDQLFKDAGADCGGAGPCGWFVYLYSEFGRKIESNNGFEEWSVRKTAAPGASKTANGTFTRTISWDITKSVSPASWALFKGDQGTSEYTVQVTKSVQDGSYGAHGTITVYNGSSRTMSIQGVVDQVGVANGGGDDLVSVLYTAPAPTCSKTSQIAPQETVLCTYTVAFPGHDGSQLLNKATVSYRLSGGGSPEDGTLIALAPIYFNAPTTVVGYETINVDDTFDGKTWQTSANASWTYPRTFACNADEGEHDNTATIRETGQDDDASVTVACYDLTVEKDADESFRWYWDIDKSADQSSGILTAPSQVFTVNYSVKVSAVQDDHAVEGTITITNPHPTRDATLTGVTDVLTGPINASVDCPALTVPKNGGTLECTYSADLPNADSRTNTATATLQNQSFDKTGAGTNSGTTAFTGTAAVSFAGVAGTDACIDVTDDKGIDPQNPLALGTVCADQLVNGEYEFTYALTFSKDGQADVILACDENTHTNVAAFETEDTGTTGSDDWSVDITVNCTTGCTLTQGYWKTHSEFGKAPYDETWAQLANGASTMFYLSNQTWYQVFWTAPGGNAYYNLAHQFMAASLNKLAGADSPPAVDAALASADALFNAYTPAQVGAWKGQQGQRSLFISLAGTLGQYNEGLIGPGHCSEDNTSAK